MLSVLPDRVRQVPLFVVLPVILTFEFLGRPLHLWQNGRAVPQTIINGPWIAAPLQFGFEMGTGVRTFMPTALPHALLVLIALSGGIGPGLLAGVGFGAGRAAMPVVRGWSRSPSRWDAALTGSGPWVGRLCALAFGIAASVLLLAG